ncbi:MAG: hypothetical protein AAB674_00430 [Patescibacteria group bacterium]
MSRENKNRLYENAFEGMPERSENYENAFEEMPKRREKREK